MLLALYAGLQASSSRFFLVPRQRTAMLAGLKLLRESGAIDRISSVLSDSSNLTFSPSESRPRPAAPSRVASEEKGITRVPAPLALTRCDGTRACRHCLVETPAAAAAATAYQESYLVTLENNLNYAMQVCCVVVLG